MKTLSPEERSQLAGEYVLGTLRGAARVRFERLVEDDPLLWQEVSFWEHRLGTLGEALPDLSPPDHILAAIAAEIGPDATKAEVRRGFWHSAPVWRGLTAMASGLAAILLVLTFLPNVDTGFQPVQVATLQNETDGSAWLVQIAADGMADVTAVGAAAPPAGTVLRALVATRDRSNAGFAWGRFGGRAQTPHAASIVLAGHRICRQHRTRGRLPDRGTNRTGRIRRRFGRPRKK